ncbi:MAG: hypothetical protein ACXVKP_19260 [Ilumatobacteraceae bacterium]
MIDDGHPLPPAFYAAPPSPSRRAWADWWVLLHPPYTLWHLSYVAIGATIAPRFDGGRLVATLVAFLLAVGVGAHALDELHGRPLGTAIPGWSLIAAAAVSLTGAVIIGVLGIERVGSGLIVFIVVGVILNCSYNLELLGGHLHNDFTFAAAWGAFPMLTAYYAQAATLRLPAVAAASAAYWLSTAQRSLSAPARTLRRRVASVEGTITSGDGRTTPLTRPMLLAPLEAALKATTWAVLSLAVALVLFRTLDR